MTPSASSSSSSGVAVEDIRVRRRHRRIPGMRLMFCAGVVAGAVLLGDAMRYGIHAHAIVPRSLELWTGYWLFMTAATWLHLSENSWRSKPRTSALVIVLTVAGFLPLVLRL